VVIALWLKELPKDLDQKEAGFSLRSRDFWEKPPVFQESRKQGRALSPSE
jgi:hypothetical protein